jgi:hypothetical protein
VFGQVLSGFDVLWNLGHVPVEKTARGENSQPLEDVFLIKAYPCNAEGKALEALE